MKEEGIDIRSSGKKKSVDPIQETDQNVSIFSRREDDENFYNDLADCFLYADAENDVFDWITAVFGVEISEEDREMIEKIE